MMVRGLVVVGFVLLGAATSVPLLTAQAPTSAQSTGPVFEAASVKRNTSIGRGPLRVQPGGRFIATSNPLEQLIEFAYDITPVQLVGIPDWGVKDRFVIIATAGHEAPEAEVRLMLQSLLAGRFHLVLRQEQREMPIHELVLARADGRLGARLVHVSGQDECGTAGTKLPKLSDIERSGAHFYGCGPISQLARGTFGAVQTAIVDKTGLTGTWLWSMPFAPTDAMLAELGAPASLPRPDPNLASFTTALEEQLGLKLRATREAVDVFVIDHVEPPTPD